MFHFRTFTADYKMKLELVILINTCANVVGVNSDFFHHFLSSSPREINKQQSEREEKKNIFLDVERDINGIRLGRQTGRDSQ